MARVVAERIVTPFQRVMAALEARGARRQGRDWTCPAHDDGRPSLGVASGRDGRALLHCAAGCATEDVVAALGLTMGDLFPDDGRLPEPAVSATYDYVDESGIVLFEVVRYFPKSFRQRRPDGNGGWVWNLTGTRRVLYRLPRVIEAAREGRRIYVVEGEKDVHAIERAGGIATCNPAGAGKWRDEFSPFLAGADVVVVADDDDAGRKHAEQMRESLYRAGVRALIVFPKAGKDAADHLAAGFGLDDFAREPSTAELTAHAHTPSDSHATVQPHPTEPPDIAFEQDILAKFLVATRLAGVVGEDNILATEYLAITSRVLAKPVSLVVKGASSSGKSFSTEVTCRFFPSKAVLPFTGMSEKALVLSERRFDHRTLVIYEASALRERAEKQSGDQTAYYIRSLISEGQTHYEMSVRTKDGGWTTKRFEKRGPTNVIVTTTAVSLHGENETRMLTLNTNDSTAQTRAVLRALALEEEREVDLKPWHDLQEWIFAQDNHVTIPFREQLLEAVPPVAVRLRRDLQAVLSLIRAHAVLHQATRERDESGRIVAELRDYEAVRALVLEAVSEGVGATVSPTIRETVAALDGVDITAAALGTKLGLDKSSAYRRLQSAMSKGFVVNLEDRRGRPGRYAVGEPLPKDVPILPEPATLQSQPEPATPEIAGQKPNLGEGCTVAAVSEGDTTEGNLGIDDLAVNGVPLREDDAPLSESEALALIASELDGEIGEALPSSALEVVLDGRRRGYNDAAIAGLLNSGGYPWPEDGKRWTAHHVRVLAERGGAQ